MATLLVDYRSDLHNNLASAVDASRWPNALLDQALRLALSEINSQLTYEASFTVTVAGYEQDLSGISAINAVLAVMYPWVDGSNFGDYHPVEWRFSGINKIYFAEAQPAVGEIIRVRYSKLHTIQNLDSASSTTVAEAHRVMVGLWAASWACDARARQLADVGASAGAVALMQTAADRYRRRAMDASSHIPPATRIRWGSIGLD